MSDSIKCPHCRKEYDANFSYCPYCAEPKPEVVTAEDIQKSRRSQYWVSILIDFIGLEFGMLFLGLISSCLIFIIIAFDVGSVAGFPFKDLFIGFCCVFTYIPIAITLHRILNKRQQLIDEQFANDETSICPECGSHSISLGRKGYDWNKGYWYRFWGVKGGHYLAGMDSRRVTARCNNCGHKWETNREWIK